MITGRHYILDLSYYDPIIPSISYNVKANGPSGTSQTDSGVVLTANSRFVVVIAAGASDAPISATMDDTTPTTRYAIPQFAGAVTIVGAGGRHRAFVLDLSLFNYGTGVKPVTVNYGSEANNKFMHVLVIDGPVGLSLEDSDREFNDLNGSPSGLTLSAVSANTLLLQSLTTRENRSDTETGDADTNILDTGTPVGCAVLRADTGLVGGGSVFVDYDFPGGTTGFVHYAWLFGT